MRVIIEVGADEPLAGGFTSFLARCPEAYNRRYRDTPVVGVQFMMRRQGQTFEWSDGVWVQSVAAVS